MRAEVESNAPGAPVRQRARGRGSILLWSAVLLLLGWGAFVSLVGAKSRLPSDWEALWDGGKKPSFPQGFLGVQRLRFGGAVEEVDGNAAFRLGGERAVLLGRWKPPISGGEFSFGAWVKLKDKLPPGKLVALAGTDHRLNWGFGAWNGKPAAWMPHRGADSIASVRIEGDEPWRTGEWTHLAVVCGSNQFRLFVDGNLVAERPIWLVEPARPDVWLGCVRQTYSPQSPPLPTPTGAIPPEFWIDDFVIFPRALSEAEVAAAANAERGALKKAVKRQQRRTMLKERAGPWVFAACFLLAVAALSPELCGRFLGGARAMAQPAYAGTWLVLITGAGLTTWATLRLAREAAEADRERLNIFSSDLREAGERYTERVADLLRRARDFARANPNVDDKEWGQWARENGLPHDYGSLDGLGFARLTRREDVAAVLSRLHLRMKRDPAETWQATRDAKQWELPVVAYQWGWNYWPSPSHDTLGWNWLTVLEDPHSPRKARDLLLTRKDVAATGLTKLRPMPSNGSNIMGMQLYLPVYRNPAPDSKRREQELLGVVFAGVRLNDLVQAYWKSSPPLFGGRLITGSRETLEDVAADTGDIFPETRRPANPYLEDEMAIRTYGRRLWMQVWTAPEFTAHSKRFWPWVSAAGGSCFTLLAAGLLAVQTRARLKERESNAQVRTAWEALKAAEKEKQAISRDIHDGAIQSLYALQLQLERSAENGTGGGTMQTFGVVRAELGRIVGELRQFTRLDEPELNLMRRAGIGEVLTALVDRARGATEAELNLRFEKEATSSIDDARAVQLANIAREALSNAIRHGNPRRVDVCLTCDGDSVRLEVRDDGAGFQCSNMEKAGQGVRNMRQRTAEAGGVMEIESRIGKGTTIWAAFPRGASTHAKLL